MVIGTKLSPQNSNAVFVTEPINVTINPHDEYHAFIVANNTLPGSYITIVFGSNDSERGQTLLIANNNGLNFTYQINQVELRGVHMALLTITFDEVTCTEFLARASKTVISDDGNKLIRVLFMYNNSSVMSYIELNRTTPRKPISTSIIEILPTTTISPISTSTLTNIHSMSTTVPSTSTIAIISTTSTTSRSGSLRFDCHITTMVLSFSVYLLLLLF